MQAVTPGELELATTTHIEEVNSEVPQETNFSFNLQVIQGYATRLREFTNTQNFWMGLGALCLIGVVIVAASGPTTCNTFDVINELDETLYISRLSPMSAKFYDADPKHPHNHPKWSPKSLFSDGKVSVQKGYTTDVEMRVDKYYSLWDPSYTLHMDSSGKPDLFWVEGNDNVHLEPTMGFFSCRVRLKDGQAPVYNTSSILENNNMALHYLRGGV